MADREEWAKALSQRLAGREVDDEAINSLADEMLRTDQNPIDVDICQYGICIDYFVDRGEIGSLLERLSFDERLGGIKIFPKGIIDPTSFLVQVERAMPR